MPQLLNVSICLTDILEQAKKGHSAFKKVTTKKGKKIYFDVRQWINDDVDGYGNISSLMLSSSEERRELEGKVYIGNGKEVKKKEPEVQPITADDIPESDDLPF